MPQYLYHNGSYCLANQPLFTAANRAFRYADSLFESMAMVNGNIPLLPMHLQRLTQSAQILQMVLPDELTPRRLLNHCKQLCLLNHIAPHARVRLTVYRANGGLYLPKYNQSLMLIETTALPPHSFEPNKEGVTIGIYPQPLVMPSVFSELKTGNALPYVIAAQYAAAHHLDNCLLLNCYHQIAETTNSNIFWVSNQTVFTPPLSSGCLNGVMRKTLLNLLPDMGLPCTQQPCTINTLLNAHEIWLTNATAGVQWVARLQEKTYYNTLALQVAEKVYNLMSDA